ncbi:MAG: hypothetical protein GY752_10710 [bacterium]|nr:hypothetical protein [bacterium]MCP4798654.1 hypothetical protein [bacterium]
MSKCLVTILSILFCLLVLPSNVFATSITEQYEINCEIDNLFWKQTDNGLMPILEGCESYLETGEPIILQLIVEVVLPTGWDVESAVFSTEYHHLELPGTVAISEQVRNSDDIAISDIRLSGQNDNWPPVAGEFIGSNTLHGETTAFFRLFPLRINRSDNSGSTAENFVVTASLVSKSDSCQPLRYVDNDVEPLEFEPRDRPSMDGSTVEFVIVTSELLKDQFQELADYKTERGIRTVVRSTEWIAENYPSAIDQQAQIRNFLQLAYQLWGTRYVLLGGDVSVIPSRMIHNTFYPPGQGTTMPVDLYYACLDGDWNADGDANMGEAFISYADEGDYVDLVAELAVGRAPVSTTLQVETFVNKIISYEQTNIGPHNGNALFMSEVLFPADYQQGGDLYEDGAIFSEEIIENAMSLSSVEKFRYYEAYDLWNGAFPETHSSVMNQMSSTDYGLVVHVGHGFFYNMSVGDRSLDLGDISSLYNNPNYFVLSSLNCASAAIDYNSILERFIINDNGGAVLAIGSSRAAFPGIASGYQYDFFTALYQSDIARVGDAIAESRSNYDHLVSMNTIERWTHMTYTLIGDPTLLFFPDEPESLEVELTENMIQGLQIVEVTVTSSSVPVENATVTLSHEDGGYSSATTDADGLATLDYIATSGDDIKCVVTAKGYRPNISSLEVVSSGESYISIQDYRIVDNGTFGSIGNGDDMAGSGETVAILFELVNSGTGWSDVSLVELACSSAACSVLTDVAEVEELNPGEVDNSVLFLVQLSAELENASTLEFELKDGNPDYEILDLLSLDIVAPVIAPSILTWADFPSGNGNGIIEEGEEIELFINLFNSGWSSADVLTGTVEAIGFGIVPIQPYGSWDNIGKLEEQDQNERFLIRVDNTSGSVRGLLTIADEYGHSWSHTFDMVRPSKPVMTSASAPAGEQILVEWEPALELDLFGYHMYRSELPNGPFSRITQAPLEGASFFRDTDLDPLTKYYYRVAATDSSRLLSQQSYTISASTTPPEVTGFPILLDVESSSHCVVGDINGNGENEIIFAADYIYVWDSTGIELRDGDNDGQTSGPFSDLCGGWGPAGVTLGDITDDPGMEIIASCRVTNSIYIFNGDGSVADGWPKQMNYWNWATPAVGDIDNNGEMEIVVNDIHGHTYVWNHDGTEFFDGDNNPETDGVFHVRPAEWYTFSSPALADLNGDDTLEIVFASKLQNGEPNNLYALDLTANNISGWPYELPALAHSHCAPAIGDLDCDGDLEIVIITENDELHVVTSTGMALSPFPIDFVADSESSGGICPSPALADFDGDNELEIVAVAIHGHDFGQIHILNLDGENLDGWPIDVEGNTESSPIVADITGDGLLDVVFGVGGGSDSAPNLLYAFMHNGGRVTGFPLSLDGPVRATPMICDVDKDLDIDIVYGGWDLAFHVWDLPFAYSTATTPWPTYHGNISRTGLYSPTEPSEVNQTPISLQKLKQNMPNPFNPSTLISFEIPTGYRGKASLNVYDLLGRNVKTLLDEEVDGGRFTVQWRGDTNSGTIVASGVYIYRLETENSISSRSMTLIR